VSWSSLPESVRTAAERELTRKQLDVLKLWANGHGTDRISLILGLSRSTVRDHLRRALQKIKPYMEEAA
jgi:DNA-binding CsgD family transcriptional regulator